MSMKTQRQLKMKQAQKRKKNRDSLIKKGAKIEDYYYGKFYLKSA